MNEWDQQPFEAPGDFGLFKTYCLLGSARTLVNVLANAPGYTFSYLLNLSRAALWDERADEYDKAVHAQEAARRRKADEDAAENWKQAQLEIAELARQRIVAELHAIAKDQENGVRMRGATMNGLIDRTHKIMQLYTGGKTDDVRTTFDISALPQAQQDALQSPEVRAALEQIAKG